MLAELLLEWPLVRQIRDRADGTFHRRTGDGLPEQSGRGDAARARQPIGERTPARQRDEEKSHAAREQ